MQRDFAIFHRNYQTPFHFQSLSDNVFLFDDNMKRFENIMFAYKNNLEKGDSKRILYRYFLRIYYMTI